MRFQFWMSFERKIMKTNVTSPSRRTLFASAVAFVALNTAGVARAQGWPQKPVKIIVPFSEIVTQ